MALRLAALWRSIGREATGDFPPGRLHQGDITMNETPVIITDLRIPFWRLVMFFVKATLAAIPAAIIVSFIVMLLAAAVSALLGGNPSLVIQRWM